MKRSSGWIIALTASMAAIGLAWIGRGRPNRPAEPSANPRASAAAMPEPAVTQQARQDVPPQPPSLVLIDDMAGGTNATDGQDVLGFWYTYSDGTGEIRPKEKSTAFRPVLYQGRRAREFSGHGQTGWGAGFGFDLNVRGEPGTAPQVLAFDGTVYEGIRFDAVSRNGDVSLAVTFSDADTNPHGGVCDPRSEDSAKMCNGDFSSDVVFPATWRTIDVKFSELRLPRWTHLAAASQNGFQKDKLYSIHFFVRPPATGRHGGSEGFDIFVANVNFVKTARLAPL
jgi:hypothetical protein